MIDLEAETRRLSNWHPSALEMFIRFTEADVAANLLLLQAAREALKSKEAADERA